MKIYARDKWAYLIDPLASKDTLTILGGRSIKTRDGSIMYRFPRLISVFNRLVEMKIIGEAQRKFFIVPPRTDTQIDPSHPAYQKMYDYQKEAVQFMISNPHGGALLCLSPGLGKGIVSVTSAEMLHAQSVLVIAELALLPMWEEEYAKWSTSGQSATRVSHFPHEGPGWQIVSVETLARHAPAYAQHHWNIIIFDEGLLIKDRNTKRFRALSHLRPHADLFWDLSGYPSSRFHSDLWSQYHLMEPEYFSSFWTFTNQYCIVADTPWGKKVVNNKPYELHREFSDLQFTRHQHEVLKDLPEAIYQTISVDLLPAQMAQYARARDELILDLGGEEMPIANKAVRLTRLQQIVSHPRNIDPESQDSSAKLEVLETLADTHAIEYPLLVWTHWRETAAIVSESLRKRGVKAMHVIGAQKGRDQVIQDFKDGKLDALVLSTSVGKHGLTFTHTKTVIKYDKYFDAEAELQQEARVRRIGLKHRPRIITLKARKTTDAILDKNISNKMGSIASTSNADLIALLQSV